MGTVQRFLALCAGVALLAACASEDDGLLLVGTVERTQVELVAPVSELVEAVHAAPGDRVEAGTVVVHLDATLARADTARAEASLAAARTALDVARRELARVERLHRTRVASAEALDRARLTRDEARARLREAEAALDAARKRERDLGLVTPVAGTVDQVAFDPGERVPAGAVVAVVLSADAPWVRVWIPEPRAASVAPGAPAVIHVDGLAAPLRGRVRDVAREAEFTPHYALTERDRVHLVYEARVTIEDAPATLRPGIPAQVALQPLAPAAAGAP